MLTSFRRRFTCFKELTGFFDYVFVDEAGQGLEPEIVVSIGTSLVSKHSLCFLP